MSIIAVFAAVKALFLGASWLKWRETRKQKILMGNNRAFSRPIPLVDRHLQRKTESATRFQIFVSSKLAEICRQFVHTHAFQYVILRIIQSRMLNRQATFSINKPEVVL